ncbi:molybdopterin-dependent oxidoreductase, partial [Candidatus Sumerlaeota bacterium]|nr:molybdopterin-dependent oxidoreductase [Candidatus Sumerlaeota bacterium]
MSTDSTNIARNVTLTIDGRRATVPQATRVITAAKTVGIEIPHFCYHPSLSIAGSCRMCLVEIEGMPKLALACDTEVREGMVVRTDTPNVAEARLGVLEFLLLNHPLDCPICDRGGECMLHRYTMDYGPGHTRTIEPRLRFRKPQLDPLLDLERNRCVLCTRCVRFMEEIAGDHAVGVFERGDRAYIATSQNRPIRNIFSGMIVDLCPVGTWTSKPFRFKARAWELQQAQSACPMCSSACRVTLWMRGGKILRVTPPTRPEWKAYFQIPYDGAAVVCNQGRFGCDFANRTDRLRQPRVRVDRAEELRAVSWDEALGETARRLDEVRKAHGPDSIGLIASSRATCEEMYLLQRLARNVIGTNNVDWRVRAANARVARAFSQALGAATGQIEDLGRYEAILVINADLLAQSPVIALKIKESARLNLARVFVLDYHLDGWLSRYAHSVVHWPVEIIESVLEGLEKRDASALSSLATAGKAIDDLLVTLTSAKSGLIVYGLDGCNGLYAQRWVRRIIYLASSLGDGWEMLPLTAERNAAGAFLVGCQPDRIPGGWSDDEEQRRNVASRWGNSLPAGASLSAPEMIEAAREGRLKALYVLGASDFHAHPWLEAICAALDRLDLLVVHDVFESPLSERADIVLPGAFFSEKEGTLVDMAGTPARFASGWQRPFGIQDDSVVLDVLAQELGKNFGCRNHGDVFTEMMRLINPLCPVRPGDLCDPGPGEESPIRCLNLPGARARLNERKSATVFSSYLPVCRLRLGTKPRSVEPPGEIEPVQKSSSLRLVWSRMLCGADDLGDRSETMT